MIVSMFLAALAGIVGAKLYLRRHGGWAFAHAHRGHHRLHHAFHHTFGGHHGWDASVRIARAPGEGPCGGEAFRRGFAGAVAARLRLSPEQEDRVRAAFDEVAEVVRPLRGEVAASRRDLAEALRKPSFDEVAMGELFARHDASLERVRRAFVGAMVRVHETLEEGQRRELARVVERGLGSWSAFGW